MNEDEVLDYTNNALILDCENILTCKEILEKVFDNVFDAIDNVSKYISTLETYEKTETQNDRGKKINIISNIVIQNAQEPNLHYL